MISKVLIAEGGIIEYDADFLPTKEADVLLTFLKDKVAWEQKYYTDRKTKIDYPQPRLTAWYADSANMEYSYSGVTQKVQLWSPELLELKHKIQTVTNAEYNSVLLNYYRDGQDSVGFHADDEKELGINANIASISLGVTRKFQLNQYKGTKPYQSCDYELSHGSLLVMSGTTQHYWKHAVPKQSSITNGRINLTFRKFNMPT